MKDIICATVGADHFYGCTAKVISREGESNTTQLQITLADGLTDYEAYLDFKKPNGEIFKTPKLTIKNKVITYDLPLSLLDEEGELSVQVVLQKSNGEIWKSSIKKYNVSKSINATTKVEERIDFVRWVEDELESKATLYEEIPDYMLPMGMRIGDVEGGRNVLVNSGIDTRKLNPQMKLIASGTTTAEANIIYITDTTGGEVTDDIGEPVVRPYALKDHICVRVDVPAVAVKANVSLKFNGVNVGQIVSSTSTTANTVSRFDAFYTGGGNWAYTGVAGSNGTAVANAWTCVGYSGQGEVITNMYLQLANSALFPVGTTYRVYGIEV